MQVTSSGAAAVWDTPTIEPIIPSSVDAYDPGSVDTFDTVDTKPLLLDGGAGYDTGYNKPLLVDEAPVYEAVSTKPLLITDDGNGDVAYGVNKPLQIDAAPEYVTVHTKPLLLTPAQAASPDAATAVAAPKASAMEIAALELLLAEPANQEMIAQFGPPLAPLNTATDVGQGIQARFGTDLGARLTQLQAAQDGVRNEFLRALDDASQKPGPDVPGSTLVPASGQGENVVPEHWTFDPAVFSQHYVQGESLAQKAFADMHGKDPLEFHPARDISDSHTDPSFYTLGSFRLTQESKPSQELLQQHGGSETNDQNSVLAYSLQRSYTQLSPDINADLINKEYLWFDPVNGWSTHGDNIQDKQSFLDKAMPTLFGAALCFIGLPPVGNFLAQAGAGTFVQGAVMGALSSSITQLASTGELNFGSMLRSALTGGITSGVMEFSGMREMLQSTDLGTRSLANFGKAGLQGVLQEATGGKFKEGFINSALASVAGEVGAHLDSQIRELKDLSPEQSSALKLMSRAAASALRVAGSNDPASGFANDFLSGVLEEQYQKASQPTPGDKPNNEWVQNLGASDVDLTQAQGLKPGSSSQGLRVLDDELSNWSDEIDGGISLTGSMAPEAPAINEAVVGKGQGPLAALAAAGLSAQEQRAAYGQLLASGQVRLNAQGVPVVQPGQVLRFDLSDTSAAQLGGRAIAAESGGRAQREAQAAQQAAAARQGMSPEQAAQIYTQYGGRSASYAGLEPAWSGRMVDVAGGGVDALGNPTGMPEQVWVSDKPPTRYAEGLGNAVRTIGHLVDGAVQLGVNGTIASMVVRPASGIAALPALALGGTEAYTAIQQDLQQQWSPESNNPGAVAIRQSMGQILAPVGQTLQQVRDASERTFGDGWTTAGVTAAQAALEVTGFLGGVAAIPAGRAALGNLGSDIRGGFNALADAMPVGSGDAARGSLASQVGAVGDLGARIAPTGNPVLATAEYGTALDYLVEGSKPSAMQQRVKIHAYENPGHHDPTGGLLPYNPTKSVLPQNHVQLFKQSKTFISGDGAVLRYAVDDAGAIHRFEPTLPGVYHWSGSTNGLTAGGRSRPLVVSANVRRHLNGG